MRDRIMSVVGVLAGLAFIAVSAGLNLFFMASQGKTPWEGYLLIGLSLAVSGFNAALPFFLESAWKKRRFGVLILGSAFFALTLTAALFSAVGFAASNRGAITGSRETVTARYDLAAQELREVETKIAALPAHRAPAVVEEALQAIKQDRLWLSSKSCADATASASLAFCKSFFQVRGELAAAIEGARLTDKQETLRREVGALKEHGAGQDVDPQAGLLAKLSGVDMPRAQMLLMCFFAMLVEFGAAFGLFFALGHGSTAGGGKGREVMGEVLPPSQPLHAEPNAGARFVPRRVSLIG